MDALVFRGAGKMEFCDVPRPVPADGEVLVKVEAVGICGSDMHGYHGRDSRRQPGLIMGHEIFGRAVTGRLADRPVVINPQVPCRHCDRCRAGQTNLCMSRQSIGVDRPGGFANFITVPELNLVAVPETLRPEAAALAEPGATSLHAVGLVRQSIREPLATQRILVFGAGAIGLLAALWARCLGGTEIEVVETNASRRQTAAAEGFMVRKPLSDGLDADSYDVVLDAVGSAATRAQGLQALRAGGMLIHIGLLEREGGIDWKRLTLSEIRIFGSFTYTQEEIGATIDAMAAGRLGNLGWLATRRMADGGAAFEELSKGVVAAPKVVLEP
jgi:alcohol dehydrogenase